MRRGQSGPSPRPRVAAAFALALGTMAVSFAAILISFARAQGVPALSIAALRMSAAALVVLPVALLRCRAELRRLSPADLATTGVSGLFLALHFGFWTSSLDSTSVMSSVVLVSTNPLFVGLASLLWLRERPSAGTVAGMTVAVAGGIVVALIDATQFGAASARGDLLALLGAVSASAYLLAGRRLRPRMSLPLYVGIVYPVAALALLAAVGVTRTPLALDRPLGLVWVAALALGPQLLGHTSYNYALRYVTATFVTVTLLAEPVGATLLAIPLLSQVPTWPQVAGGALILVGIAVSARGESPQGKMTVEM